MGKTIHIILRHMLILTHIRFFSQRGYGIKSFYYFKETLELISSSPYFFKTQFNKIIEVVHVLKALLL